MSLTSDNENMPLIVEGEPSKCPICLEEILNLTYANECRHAFCFECINEWVKEHNKCPMCRQVIRFICFNVRSTTDYQMIEVMPPVVQRESVIQINSNYSLIIAPDETGLYIVFPYRTQHQIHYVLQYLNQGQSYIMRTVDPGALYVLPDDLNRVLARLENAGIYRYFPHVERHPLCFKPHRNHQPI